MPNSQELFNLNRFLQAQEPVYAQALQELRKGQKRTHWMWFIFPQIAGLGHSPTAQHFSISSIEEAKEYAQHPVLGPRLVECTTATLQHEDKSAQDIFGYPDWMKFRSSMTLFELASADPCFAKALETFFNGERDARTLELLR